MDIRKFKDILEVLNSVGVEEVIFEPTDDNGTRIRGADKHKRIVVFDTIEDELVTASLGIQSVRGIMSRLSLVDLEKASVSLETKDSKDGEFVINFAIKQGKKVASYKCANPFNKSLAVPSVIPNTDAESEINFSAEYTTYLLQALQSLSITGDKEKRYIMMEAKNDVLTLEIFDGEDDSFGDDLEDVVTEDFSPTKWEIEALQRMVKVNTDGGKQGFVLGITEAGIAVFDMDVISVMIVPLP